MSLPWDIYGVDPCLDTRIARYISKYQEIPDVPSLNKCLRLLGTEGLQKGIEFLNARN